jgi:hypothetical protein
MSEEEGKIRQSFLCPLTLTEDGPIVHKATVITGHTANKGAT